MRIAVFGATGRLGRELIRAALAQNHGVTAHSRRANAEMLAGLTWVSGDAGQALRKADAALIAFGPRSPQDRPFCRAETASILECMKSEGRRRVLCVTGAMVGEYPTNRTWCFRHFSGWIQKRYPDQMRDRAEQESAIRASGLDWTIFKPPRLTMGPPRETANGPAVRVGLLSSVSRASLARLMVQEAAEGRFVRQAIFVKE